MAEAIWIGPRYQERRIFVLGESWYGDYADNTDAGYIRLYLEGCIQDRMYTRMANACGMTKHDFWNGILFTNFVQRVGDARDCRPTRADYTGAGGRLAALLDCHRPKGVWVLGKEQAEFSAPYINRAGIPFEVTAHPTSYGLSNAALGESWTRLLAQLNSEAKQKE